MLTKLTDDEIKLIKYCLNGQAETLEHLLTMVDEETAKDMQETVADIDTLLAHFDNKAVSPLAEFCNEEAEYRTKMDIDYDGYETVEEYINMHGGDPDVFAKVLAEELLDHCEEWINGQRIADITIDLMEDEYETN